MPFLGLAPGAVPAVFAQVLDDQAHVFQMTNARLGMSEPEAFRMGLDQGLCPRGQLRRRTAQRWDLSQVLEWSSPLITPAIRQGPAQAPLPMP